MNLLRNTARLALLLLAACSFAGSTLAIAGDTSGKKCEYSTQDCLNHMAAAMKASGWIGIEYEPKENTGETVIQRVVPGSPAEKAGLHAGDVLYALDGVEINEKNRDVLTQKRKQWAPGKTISYTIKRGAATTKLPVTLGEWPADLLAKYIGQHMLEHAVIDADATAQTNPKHPKKK